MHKQGEPLFRRHVKKSYPRTMMTISFFLKNTSAKNLPAHSVCLAVTFGSRTLSLLMDMGANQAFRFSCRAGTEPAPTTIRQHPQSTFPLEETRDASPRAASERAPN